MPIDSSEDKETTRIEAFSDGVLAIIITIMVLELHVPEGGSFNDLKDVLPTFLAYLLSFTYVGIYWNNHHHLLRATKKISGRVMWSNLHLLFWLSLTPFVTAWLGEHYTESWPAAAYGFVCFMSGLAYFILTKAIIAANHGTVVEAAIKNDLKGILSQVFYALAIACAFISPYISYALFVLVSIMWFVPDRRLADLTSKTDTNTEE